MFIIFGSDKKYAPIASLITASCTECEATTSWSIWKETEWASLFFIRILPLATRYHLGCDKCGYGLALEKNLALAMLNPENRTQTLHDEVVALIQKSQFYFRRQKAEQSNLKEP